MQKIYFSYNNSFNLQTMLLQKSIYDFFDPNCQFQPSPYIAENENFLLTGNQTLQNQKVENHILISFHKIYGNKWKQISNHLPNTSDSFIKNMFYTLARKALRKVNLYIELDSKAQGKKPKVFKLNFVFKLANLAESQRITESKQHLDVLKGFYTKLLYNLLDMGNIDTAILKNETSSLEEENLKQTIQNLIENLRIIERIFIEQNLIKKGRTKKKFPKKGLIEKAYSSKAFKQSFEDFDTHLSLSSSMTHSKQLKQDSQITQEPEGLGQILDLEAVQEKFYCNKDEFDTFLQIKSFDPILFE